ncbi:DUF917 domain-containing protein [Streptosporangium sp. 'caverna']|uniref:DUF917 domain-containing protein n=1 Tax=Streptosporangium sp. 'caverna' TaxID=2202249 RepID=UPI000D7E86ED|nr:DUF917 domain-containing protein [Streptosporangium sp. 'caverna']AWS45355.1 DUF917 domain-containing protein [Streptosporangium sp. 'caverna']
MITEQDVAALDSGCVLLGSGGGGPSATMATLLRQRLRAAPVPFLAVAGLPRDAVVVPIGFIGSTGLLDEKLPSGGELDEAIEVVARWSGVRVDAVMSLEAGGVNGLAAFCCGRPVVDADLMGRAFPRLGHMSTSRANVAAGPYAMVDAAGRTTVMDRCDPDAAERMIRGALAASGGWAAFAHWPIRAADLPGQAIVGSLSRALGLGRTMLSLPGRAPRAAALGGRLAGTGRVVEVDRRPSGRGTVTVLDHGGAVLRVEMENEYQVVFRDGVPVATTPDVLCLLESRTGAPIACHKIRPGHRVEVVQLASPALWRRPDRLAQVSPTAFGIEIPPCLLEDGDADGRGPTGDDPSHRNGTSSGDSLLHRDGSPRGDNLPCQDGSPYGGGLACQDGTSRGDDLPHRDDLPDGEGR